MKVLHVNTWNTGGAAKACLRLHEGLRANGVDSKVLLKSKTSDAVEEVYEVWQALNPLQKAQQLLSQKRLDSKAAKALKGLPERTELFTFCDSVWDISSDPNYQEADVIHLHWVAGLLDYPTFFAKNTKPLVWTLHDFSPFSGGFHYPFGVDHITYGSLTAQELERKRTAIGKHAMTVISPSQYLNKIASGSELLRHAKHKSIPNGIDVETYYYRDQTQAKQELDIDPNAKLLLFVADRLDYPRKGFSILLEALNSNNLPNVKLGVVGDASGIELPDNAHHFGAISDEQKLAKIYAAAELFVIPSLADNLPNTVVESLCCGTPVVGFDIGGIPEMITHQQNGIICDSNDALGLVAGITTAMETGFDRQKISDCACGIYDQTRVAVAYAEAYNAML